MWWFYWILFQEWCGIWKKNINMKEIKRWKEKDPTTGLSKEHQKMNWETTNKKSCPVEKMPVKNNKKKNTCKSQWPFDTCPASFSWIQWIKTRCWSNVVKKTDDGSRATRQPSVHRKQLQVQVLNLHISWYVVVLHTLTYTTTSPVQFLPWFSHKTLLIKFLASYVYSLIDTVPDFSWSFPPLPKLHGYLFIGHPWIMQECNPTL